MHQIDDAAVLRKQRMRWPVGVLLLTFYVAVGFWAWWEFGASEWHTWAQVAFVALQAGVASLPPINRWLGRQLDALRVPTPRQRTVTTIMVGMAGMAYLFFSAMEQHRDFFPKFHDEFMHLIQARMLARGRLWMPAHAMPQFFETFHVFVKPVYASMQFPGTSMLYVPGMWLHLPYWITPLVIGGLTLGLMYRVVAELIDGVAGLLTAMMLLGILEFRYLSLMALSNPAALMLGLLILWAWLRWRVLRTAAAALLVGGCAGLAAITRPPDALCFALPVGFAMLWQLRGQSRRAWRTTAIGLLLGAAPFLLLQAVFNRGVTGSWLQTPHELYVKMFHPGCAFGLQPVSALARPQTTLQQKINYYDSFVAPDAARYTPFTAPRLWLRERLPMLFKASLPSTLLLLLIPAGLPGLLKQRRWVLFAVFPMFVGVYGMSTLFAPQYCIITAAAMIPLAILGARAFGDATPAPRNAAPVVAVALCCVSLSMLPQLNSAVTDQFAARSLATVERQLANINGPAVVFFRYRPGVNVHEEPVYNIDSADIDSHRIVRAQELGATENLKLIRYYAQRQPAREAYLFDRADGTLLHLGRVKNLAGQGDMKGPPFIDNE